MKTFKSSWRHHQLIRHEMSIRYIIRICIKWFTSIMDSSASGIQRAIILYVELVPNSICTCIVLSISLYFLYLTLQGLQSCSNWLVTPILRPSPPKSIPLVCNFWGKNPYGVAVLPLIFQLYTNRDQQSAGPNSFISRR